MTSQQPPALARRLNLVDAVVIGMGSMMGAGVFVVFAPAAAAAGAAIVFGLVIAAGVALLNALSSAQLAAQYPVSGGSYIFGREQLGHWPGFFAGWSFVIGKTASCAAMALTVAHYLVPAEWVKVLAIAAVLALVVVNSFGITRTVGLTKILVALVLVVLALVVFSGVWGPDAQPAVLDIGSLWAADWYGVLQAAALLFFAFAGYARVATLGEEVRAPKTTIPRAIVLALAVVLLVYIFVGSTALFQLGPEALATSSEPLREVVIVAGWEWAAPLVSIGAALAALGALLALLTGLSRTILAMARNRDLPVWLGVVHQKYQVPRHAEAVIAIAVSALILVVDIRFAIGFSSFGVLLYYLITNLSAFTQTAEHRRFPRVFALLGAAACGLLVMMLPWESVVSGLVVLLVGIVYRSIRLRFTSGKNIPI